MRKISMLFLLSASLVLTSCAGKSGNTKLGEMKKEEIHQIIYKGKTTKEEVRKIFGDPQSTDFDIQGHEKWTYKHVRHEVKGESYIPVVNWFSRGTDDEKKKLVIIFDDEGRVMKYAESQSNGETKVGLFQ